jgi:hypothetical protein
MLISAMGSKIGDTLLADTENFRFTSRPAGNGGHFPGVDWARDEANHSLPPGVEVKNT